MRIVALAPQAIINSVYRSFIPMQALAHRGHAVHLEERNEVRNPQMLLEADLVHFMRFYQPAMLRMARLLREKGVAVAWDNDDDISADHPGSRDTALMRQHIRSRTHAMVRNAHVVTTPSSYLADRYRALTDAPVRVLENHLPPTFTRPARVMPHNGVTIGWLAALEHQADYERLGLKDTFERILARHNHVEIISVGLGLGLNSRRYTHYPITEYGRLPEIMVHFDIGLAPLIETPFNNARSNIKLKEYAATGVPWLASPRIPYAGMGEAQGGRLVEDDDWYRALEQLVLDADARSRLARRARMWAAEETIEHHVDAWEETFGDAIERARAAAAVGR